LEACGGGTSSRPRSSAVGGHVLLRLRSSGGPASRGGHHHVVLQLAASGFPHWLLAWRACVAVCTALAAGFFARWGSKGCAAQPRFPYEGVLVYCRARVCVAFFRYRGTSARGVWHMGKPSMPLQAFCRHCCDVRVLRTFAVHTGLHLQHLPVVCSSMRCSLLGVLHTSAGRQPVYGLRWGARPQSPRLLGVPSRGTRGKHSCPLQAVSR
jgi:hypothetical protein